MFTIRQLKCIVDLRIIFAPHSFRVRVSLGWTLRVVMSFVLRLVIWPHLQRIFLLPHSRAAWDSREWAEWSWCCNLDLNWSGLLLKSTATVLTFVPAGRFCKWYGQWKQCVVAYWKPIECFWGISISFKLPTSLVISNSGNTGSKEGGAYFSVLEQASWLRALLRWTLCSSFSG